MSSKYGSQMKKSIDLILIKNKRNQKKHGDHGLIKSVKFILMSISKIRLGLVLWLKLKRLRTD